jgi:flotillin
MAKVGEVEALQTERIKTAEANARSVEGENNSKIDIAKSEATRGDAEAEANRMAMAAEKVKQAKALEEAYLAEKSAEDGRALRDRATQTANIIVPAEIDNQKIAIDAEAEAEMICRRAKGEAEAIYLKMQAEANGNFEILSKQAEGFRQLVAAAGENTKDTVTIMIADKLTDLVKLQSEAIQNIKFDKVTVRDSAGGNSENGKTATSNFISGLYQSVPPLQDMFNMAGMNLPNYLKGDEKGEDAPEKPATGKKNEKT